MSTRIRQDEGASAVEFALVLPLLLLFIFGIIYFGFAFNTQLSLTQAAREGARLGATRPVDEVTGLPDSAWYDAVAARIENAAFGDTGLGNEDRKICIRFVGTAGAEPWWTRGVAAADVATTCMVTVDPLVAAEPHVQVFVERRVPIELVVFGSHRVDLGGTAVARYEGAL